ncbi:MAG: hypothetical protein ACRYFS_21980 [Janthinobacterium lividum]
MAKYDLSFGRQFDRRNPEHVAAAVCRSANQILACRGKTPTAIQLELRGLYGSVSHQLRSLARIVDELAIHPEKMLAAPEAESETDVPESVGLRREIEQAPTPDLLRRRWRKRSYTVLIKVKVEVSTAHHPQT